MKKNARTKPTPKTSEMPGTDFGVSRSTAIMPAPDYNDNLRAADIMGCAYGEDYSQDLDTVLPVLTLVAKNAAPLREAFFQFSAWVEATGPNALVAEILYSDVGYHLALGPSYRDGIWRTLGLDQLYSIMFWGVTYIKTMDSRQDMLQDLARYSQNAVAPVLLYGATLDNQQMMKAGRAPQNIAPIPECPKILLLKLPIYQTRDELPEFSSLRTIGKTGPEASSSRDAYSRETKEPLVVSAARERRLRALMPALLHKLRTDTALKRRVDALAVDGVVRWQVEQAIVNQRLWALASPRQRSSFQDAAGRFKLAADFIEHETPGADGLIDDERVLGQVSRDCRYLLKSLGLPVPSDRTACLRSLRQAGYLTSGDVP